jgi:O-antigen ligase
MFELAKIIVSLISLWLVIAAIKESTNRYLAFFIFALWLRFFLAAFHSITYVPMLGGLSITAFASIFMAGVGFYIIPTRFLLLKKMVPFYLFIAAIILSAFFNGLLVGLANVMVKWIYFLCVTCAFFLSVQLSGVTHSCRRAITPFILPLSLQVLSVLLGESKITDSDGQLSYIGGYNHESGFSMIIVGFMILVSLLPRKTIQFQAALFICGVFFIYLTNYRTAILAVLPVVAIFLYSTVEGKIEKRYRLPIISLSVIFFSSLVIAFISSHQERFNDVFVFAESWMTLIKAPVYFTEIEKDIFSARVFIWSEYIYAFSQSDFWHQLFGYGPESWSGVFDKYAHNTFISYLYEYGLLGLGAFLFLNLYILLGAWNMREKAYSKKIFFSIVGFLILNLATMPLWALEGMIVYGMLISMTFANPIELSEREFYSK